MKRITPTREKCRKGYGGSLPCCRFGLAIMDRKGEGLIFHPNAGPSLKSAARRLLSNANGGKSRGPDARASSVPFGAVQPKIMQPFHVQQCPQVMHPAAADNGYEQPLIGHKPAEDLLDVRRDTDFGRMGLEWNEGSVAIEKQRDFLCFAQPSQDSTNISKYGFRPAGGPPAPLFGRFVVGQILWSEYLRLLCSQFTFFDSNLRKLS